MKDLIVFKVGNNRYALNIENIQRIIQATELIDIPNSHPFIDGMLSYEDDVIKVMNFRTLIGIQRYKEELETLFTSLKAGHQSWIDGLRQSVDSGATFTGALDPHKCKLGIWLDNFNSYDDKVTAILKDLIQNHKDLHLYGSDVLKLKEVDKKQASNMIDKEVYDSFSHTMSDIDLFMSDLDKVSDSLQKFIIYEDDADIFAIKVDVIEDIAHIEDKDIISANKKNSNNEFLTLNGILDLKGVLINIIETVKLPN